MFILNDLPPPIDEESRRLLGEVETATVGHFRHAGFMDHRLRPVMGEHRIAGTAVTVSIPGPDSALLHHVMGLVRPGDVLVVDRCGDERHACWGGFMATAAASCGVAGVVIDGPVTDTAEIRANGVPTWCRGVSPITTKLLALGGALNTEVSCGGVAVCPGDAILADESGILVLDPGGRGRGRPHRDHHAGRGDRRPGAASGGRESARHHRSHGTDRGGDGAGPVGSSPHNP